MNAKNAMLCWNPGTAQVALVRWPDPERVSSAFEMSGLACYSAVQKMTFEQRKLVVFVEAMHLIVRDKCDPLAVHSALLALDEYQAGLACDMPGATP